MIFLFFILFRHFFRVQPFIIAVTPGAVSAESSSYRFPQFPSAVYSIIATAGVKQSVIVTTRDEFGNVLSTRMGETLSMELNIADQISAESFSFSQTVSYIGYGQFLIVFQLLSAQNYKLQILISGQQISNSPFTCIVEPSFPVGEMSFNTSVIPSVVVAGETANFTVQVVLFVVAK